MQQPLNIGGRDGRSNAIRAHQTIRSTRLLCHTAVIAGVAALSVLSAQAQTTGGTWTKKAPLAAARGELAVIEVDGKIYAVGGTLQDAASPLNSAYDPATDTWSDRAPLPKAMHHIGLASLDGKLYAIGGFTENVHLHPQALALVYDPKSNRWEQLANLSGPRGSVAVAAVLGKIHIFGGRDSRNVTKVTIPNGPELSVGNGTVSIHEIYDPSTNTWSLGKELPDPPRDHVGIAVLDDKVHLFGGRVEGTSQNLEKHDVYDPKTDTWTSAAPLPRARSAGAFTVLNGLILYAGGECKQGGSPGTLNTFEDVTAYDAKTGTWSTLASLPQARHGFGAGTVGKVAYFAGGAPTCGGGSSTDLFAFSVP